ncbi:unnamed protein product [Caenorhabditis bovis]|uniref:CCHC-type domain-containing protein n=1 Tax=Caenorhabditis bovis TaxID=2654633 RepID=A0A8S1FBI4_9PELO|nr:unnamed protein product [Caenorhabditis bovis]
MAPKGLVQVERLILELEEIWNGQEGKMKALAEVKNELKEHGACAERMKKLMKDGAVRLTERQKDGVVMVCGDHWTKMMEMWRQAEEGMVEEVKENDGTAELLGCMHQMGLRSVADVEEMLFFNEKKGKEIEELELQIVKLHEERERQEKQVVGLQQERDSLIAEEAAVEEEKRKLLEELDRKGEEEREWNQNDRILQGRRREAGRNESSPRWMRISDDPWRKGTSMIEEDIVRREEKEKGSGLKEALEGMVAMNLLGDPEPYDVGTNRNFRAFVGTFLAKYGKLITEEQGKIAIWYDRFLKGKAKTIFNGLGEEVWGGTFEEAVEKMEKAISGMTVDGVQQAWKRWNALRKREEQKVADYCAIIEEVSGVVFRESSKETMAQARLSKLMEGITDTAQRNFLTMRKLEVEPKEQYEKLKQIAIAFELERGEGRRIGKPVTASQNKTIVRQGGVVMRSEKICYKCGGRGHLSYECLPDRPAYTMRAQQNNTGRNVPMTQGGNGSRGVVRAWDQNKGDIRQVNKVEKVGDGEPDVGLSMTEMGVILGQEVEFLLDSGAVVSVLSSKIWERLIANGGEWEKETVKLIGIPKYALVTAEKRPLEAVGQVECQLTMRGRTAKISIWNIPYMEGGRKSGKM